MGIYANVLFIRLINDIVYANVLFIRLINDIVLLFQRQSFEILTQ
jgi:hypothetical protein